MINHKKNMYYVVLNFILTFICYRQLFIIFNESLNLPMYIVFMAIYFMYYILDLLSFLEKFEFHDFIYSIIINTIFCILFLAFYKKTTFLTIFIIYTIIQLILNFLFHHHGHNIGYVMLIDDGQNVEKIVSILNKNKNYKFVGYINDKNNMDKCNYLGTIEKIDLIIEENNISSIIFVKNGYVKKNAERLVKCKLRGIKVVDYFSFLEEFEGKIDTEKIDNIWVLMSNSFTIEKSSIERKIKRCFDLIMAILLFIISLPFMLFTYMLVKCDIGLKYLVINPIKILKNPAFFKQKRLGYRGQLFEIIKFRSMKIHDPDKYSKYASEDDKRITKIGKFIRKTRLDELPQIINVIKGDMSFVGPRPEWDELGREYEKKIKNYSLRYVVQPGITGWAQTMYSYGASLEDAKVKLEYDLYYVKNKNFILDIIILFRTTKIVLFGKGM